MRGDLLDVFDAADTQLLSNAFMNLDSSWLYGEMCAARAWNKLTVQLGWTVRLAVRL